MPLITDQQIRQFKDVGYFVTDVMFSPKELAELSAEFDRVHAMTVADAQKGSDATALELARLRPFIGQFHTRSEPARRFVKAPIYAEACATFIGPDADLYYNQAVIKPPELGRSFAWHQDSGYVKTTPVEYITCWTAISRTFVENGCIWVIPGSHKRGLLEHKWDEKSREQIPDVGDESIAIPVEMKAGQVAIFSSLTLHKSGPNVSKEIRRAYVPQYHHVDVIADRTGKPWGDLWPVLRGGKLVPDPVAAEPATKGSH
ncbi:MAG: phytanoyl-CoA dioxygenase family protein [Planctomycetota bacterium]|nr:phytanoyl-CoA dioxygenase family protein [Planctomycetota bacterium]